MQKFFVINFDDGFDLTDQLERVQFVLKTFPGIEYKLYLIPGQLTVLLA